MSVLTKTMAGLAQMGFADVAKDFGVTLHQVAEEMVKGSCDHEEATLRVAARVEERHAQP